MSLTVKQQKFVDEYLKCFNATKAARLAGYNATNGSLANIGYENVRKREIAEKISQRLQESAMSADEVLNRLAQQARGSIESFLDFEISGKLPIVDLGRAKELGLLHLIKKLKYNPKGGLEIELYDAQSALSLLGKHHSLFTDRLDIRVEKELEYILSILEKALEAEDYERILGILSSSESS